MFVRLEQEKNRLQAALEQLQRKSSNPLSFDWSCHHMLSRIIVCFAFSQVTTRLR